jgi:hypothetical protein
MSTEMEADTRMNRKVGAATRDIRTGALAAGIVTPPASEARSERLALKRFIECALQEAYLLQETPARFIRLLDKLRASRGEQ